MGVSTPLPSPLPGRGRHRSPWERLRKAAVSERCPQLSWAFFLGTFIGFGCILLRPPGECYFCPAVLLNPPLPHPGLILPIPHRLPSSMLYPPCLKTKQTPKQGQTPARPNSFFIQQPKLSFRSAGLILSLPCLPLQWFPVPLG